VNDTFVSGQPTPSLENGRFQWLVHQSDSICQQTFGTLQTSLLSSIMSKTRIFNFYFNI